MAAPTLLHQTSLLFPSPPNGNASSSLSSLRFFRGPTRHLLGRCSAKKKISFVDQILDYIEGGPKLRKWYGAPDLLPKDGSAAEDDDDEFSEDDGEERDAILVTDGDCEIAQMVILSLIVKRSRVKALVKDKRTALEAFGTYVEVGAFLISCNYVYMIRLFNFSLPRNAGAMAFNFMLCHQNEKSMAGDSSSKPFLKKALRGVRAIICTNEGFLANVGSLKGVKHIILLSQLSVYKGSSGIQAIVKSNARKLAEQDEAAVMASGIPYTIIRAGTLQNTPGGTQGFSFQKGVAAKGSLSKEDAAFICVEALNAVPKAGFILEVANGEEKVSDWQECLATLMETSQQ